MKIRLEHVTQIHAMLTDDDVSPNWSHTFFFSIQDSHDSVVCRADDDGADRPGDFSSACRADRVGAIGPIMTGGCKQDAQVAPFRNKRAMGSVEIAGDKNRIKEKNRVILFLLCGHYRSRSSVSFSALRSRALAVAVVLVLFPFDYVTRRAVFS